MSENEIYKARSPVGTNMNNDRITIDMYPQQLFHIDLKPFVHQQHHQIYIAVDMCKWLQNTPQVGGNRILLIGLTTYGGCWGYIS